MRRWSVLLLGLVACASAPPRDRWDDAELASRAPAADGAKEAAGSSATPGASPLRPLFFEVTSPGARHPMHLLGSIHVLDEAEPSWDPRIDQAFDAAEALVVEADVRSPEGLSLVAELGMLPPEESLEDHVSPAVFDGARRAAMRHGQPVEALRRLRPWLAALLLSGLTTAKLGYSEELGVDRHFLERAGGKKAVVELEGMEVQLRLFRGMGPDAAQAMLEAASRPETELAAELEGLVAAWKRGDEVAMEAAFLEPARATPALEQFTERLFYDRNRSMADALERLAGEDRRLFVVVGAGHLVGTRGIPALLAAKGLVVRRLAPDDPQVKK